MAFKKAERRQRKLRLALFGTSGSGKTYSALRLATGIANKIEKRIAFIDSENDTALMYADRFDFDWDPLVKKTVDEYISKWDDAEKAGYGVLIIDSMSHAWAQLLAEVDKIAKAKYKGNTWSAWSEGGPIQNKLIDKILNSQLHLIVTMRSKTEWTVTTDNNGKSKPTRVGLAPQQGKDIEFEFDMLCELSNDHYANIIKDRTGKFQDANIEKISEELGEELIELLQQGKEYVPQTNTTPPTKKASAGTPPPAKQIRNYAAEIEKFTSGDELIKWWMTLTPAEHKEAVSVKDKKKADIELLEKKNNKANAFLDKLVEEVIETTTVDQLEAIDKLIDGIADPDSKREYISKLSDKLTELKIDYVIQAQPF